MTWNPFLAVFNPNVEMTKLRLGISFLLIYTLLCFFASNLIFLTSPQENLLACLQLRQGFCEGDSLNLLCVLCRRKCLFVVAGVIRKVQLPKRLHEKNSSSPPLLWARDCKGAKRCLWLHFVKLQTMEANAKTLQSPATRTCFLSLWMPPNYFLKLFL